jgi:Tfp pilus assembly protein PilF
MIRTRSITAATIATLVATTGCGGKDKQPEVTGDSGVVSVPVATAPVTEPVVPTVDTTPTVYANVSFEDAEKAFTERRYGEAAKMFEAYTGRRPDNAWGHYMLGLSAWKAGDLEKARGGFERALELDPKHVKSMLNLTRVLLDQGKPNEALGRVGEVMTVDSTSGEVWRLMGRVRTALRQPDAAIEAYRTALALDPEDTWAMNNMGLVLIQQGRFAEALPPLARATQLDSEVVVFRNNLGIALERTGHYVAAAEAYRGALAIDSTYTKASLSLARVNGRTDDPSVGPVDLASLGEEFAREVRTWWEARGGTVGMRVSKTSN